MTAGRRADASPSLVDHLFPPACVICGATIAPTRPPLCTRCDLRLPSMATPLCRRCGATATAAAEGECGECRDWDEGAPRCRTPYRMEGGAARVVRALKYGGWTRLAGSMARSMERDARRLAAGRRVILVPVPLSPARLRERGFNQAELIAARLGSLTGWAVRRWLRRESGGRAQAGSGRSARQTNVSGAFQVNGELQENAPVLLIDDVITTGATIRTCSSALEAGGARVAGAVAFARTLPPIHGA